MAINIELRKSNGTTYAGDANLLHFRTNVNLVDDLLGLDGKLKSSLIPAYIMGGHKYVGTLNAPINTKTHWDSLLLAIEGWVEVRGVYKPYTGPVDDILAYWANHFTGKYFVIGSTLTVDPVAEIDGHTFVNYDAGHETGPHTLEAGDWLIYDHYDTGTSRHYWAVVNNTYQDATATDRGVVKLATDAEGEAGLITTKAMTPKSTVAAINARAYGHPSFSGNGLGAALTGKKVISDVTVNSNGHVTGFKTREISLADLGYTGAIDANKYTHPLKAEFNVTADEYETISTFNTDSTGHVTQVTKKWLPSASIGTSGLVVMANSSELIDGNLAYDRVTSPADVKSMIDRYASIAMVSTLPTDMADHPSGKLIMLQI